MKRRAQRAVMGRGQIERQRRGDRLLAVPCARDGKAARFRKREAPGAVGFEQRRRITLQLPLYVRAASSDRIFWKRKKPRDPTRRQGRQSQTQTSAHTAIMRRRRAMVMVAAIGRGAGGGLGRGESRGRGYKPPPARRQVMTAIPAGSGVRSPDSTAPGSPGS